MTWEKVNFEVISRTTFKGSEETPFYSVPGIFRLRIYCQSVDHLSWYRCTDSNWIECVRLVYTDVQECERGGGGGGEKEILNEEREKTQRQKGSKKEINKSERGFF
jgi:hypothetical protein